MSRLVLYRPNVAFMFNPRSVNKGEGGKKSLLCVVDELCLYCVPVDTVDDDCECMRMRSVD